MNNLENANHRRPRIALLFFAAASVLVASIVLIFWMGIIVQKDARSLVRQKSIVQQWDQILISLENAETGQRGYLLTGEEEYLAPYNEALAKISPQMDQVRNQAKNLVSPKTWNEYHF